jgi:hypothetical protein
VKKEYENKEYEMKFNSLESDGHRRRCCFVPVGSSVNKNIFYSSSSLSHFPIYNEINKYKQPPASHLHCHFLPPAAAVANKTQFLLPRTLSARAWLGSKSKLSALNFIFFTQFLLFFLARRCAHQKNEHCRRPLSFLI